MRTYQSTQSIEHANQMLVTISCIQRSNQSRFYLAFGWSNIPLNEPARYPDTEHTHLLTIKCDQINPLLSPIDQSRPPLGNIPLPELLQHLCHLLGSHIAFFPLLLYPALTSQHISKYFVFAHRITLGTTLTPLKSQEELCRRLSMMDIRI